MSASNSEPTSLHPWVVGIQDYDGNWTVIEQSFSTKEDAEHYGVNYWADHESHVKDYKIKKVA